MSPSYHHSYVQSNLIAMLQKSRQFSIFSELSLQIEGKEFVPDICVYPKRAINFADPDMVRVAELPLLAIEILSPSQTMMDAWQKIETYLTAGIKSCWLVQPSAMSVTVYAAPHQGQIFNTGELIDATVNIRLPLEEMFI